MINKEVLYTALLFDYHFNCMPVTHTEIPASLSRHPIILFDGICNLCNKAVLYVIKHDKDALFKFASLQSEQGKILLKQFNLATKNFDSFVLIADNKVYTKSTAALKVARLLNGSGRLLYGFIIIPAFIRDAVYRFISRNRYTWFGKKNECIAPGVLLQERFLN